MFTYTFSTIVEKNPVYDLWSTVYNIQQSSLPNITMLLNIGQGIAYDVSKK